MNTWLNISPDSDFSIHNLPFGIFSVDGGLKRVGVAIGDFVIDLKIAHSLGVFTKMEIDQEVFAREYLNDFIALGKPVTNQIRIKLQQHLSDNSSPLKTPMR